MAGSILADLGASVTKVELKSRPDPFHPMNEGSPEKAFGGWYSNINSNKEALVVDSLDDDDVVNLLSDTDVALIPNSKHFSELKETNPKVVFIEVCGGSGQRKYLHDLNALFLTKSFKLHLQATKGKSLPYLPFAGVIFAQQIALEVMSAHIESLSTGTYENRRVYLDKSTQSVLDKLWIPEMDKSPQVKYLHTGKYPCYNIYRTADGCYIGLAAVEDKFWTQFCQIFKLPLSLEDRYDESGKTGQSISKMFLNYNKTEIETLIGDKDMCISLLPDKEKEMI